MNNKKKYLVHLDILGFEALPREIAKATGFDENWIRENLLSKPLKEKVEEIKSKGFKVSEGISTLEGSDNYILMIDGIQSVFEIIDKFTTIKIPHKDYNYIPLEVAAGVQQFKESINVKLINREETIAFLKDDVIMPYRKYYKELNNKRIEETFVLFTQQMFGELESLDRKHCCKQITSNGKTLFVADLERIKQRCRIFKFLEKIGFAGSNIYGRIDELYISPIEYNDIATTLKKKRIVFITGTPEYGKTYTAVKLMWDYYNKGYEPRWIKGEEEWKRSKIREKLEDLRGELQPKHIIYFEDPFGKIRYERREGLERKIGAIIDCLNQVKDAYIIITSREEIFKEFEKESLSPDDLRKFENKLSIKRPSYDYEARKRILIKYAEKEECKWFKNKNMKNFVLEKIKENLPTPLNIRDFVIASINIESEDELTEKIKEKSEETPKVFAKEIRSMSNDKILFLALPFIDCIFDVVLAKAVYQELIDELKLKDAWGFDRVLNWFKDDKITLTDEYYITFSHPSYSAALKYLLVEDGYISRISSEIFSKVLFRLLENGEEAVKAVERFLAYYFGELPESIRERLLLKISDFRSSMEVGLILVENFHKLPKDVIDKLLEKAEVARYIAAIITHTVTYVKFKILREVICFKLWGDERKKKLFFKPPNDVIDKLLENDEVVFAVSRIVVNNLNEVSEAVMNNLLDNQDVLVLVTIIALDNFNKLPEDKRAKLLIKLLEKDKTSIAVTGAIAFNYKELPEDVKNLLDRFQEPLQQIIETASNIQPLEAISLISNVWSKIKPDFLSEILKKLSKSEDKEVRIKAAKLLKDII